MLMNNQSNVEELLSAPNNLLEGELGLFFAFLSMVCNDPTVTAADIYECIIVEAR